MLDAIKLVLRENQLCADIFDMMEFYRDQMVLANNCECQLDELYWVGQMCYFYFAFFVCVMHDNLAFKI